MIFVKVSQNFIKPHLKNCLISQISAHSLWHVCILMSQYSMLQNEMLEVGGLFLNIFEHAKKIKFFEF